MFIFDILFAVVDSESHFSFCMILGTILNISISIFFFFFVEESLSVLKSEMFNVPLSLL